MTYTPPIAEQRFLLEHVVRLGELVGHNAFAEATPDLVDAILEGAGAFAAGEFAPLNRVGDQVGARWSDGAVTMPTALRKPIVPMSKAAGARSQAPPNMAARAFPSPSPAW